MKQILLPEESSGIKYYRANLHCHSTVSDGSKTVEQLKADYISHGYSIIAFTDHDVFLTHNDLTDDNFLALNGYEIEVGEDDRTDGESDRTCHLCFVALDKDNDKAVCYHRSKYIWGNGQKYRDRINFDSSLPDYERKYTPESINDMIKKGKEGGFFVTYNHPFWSIETYPEFSAYEGMDAMEIVNFGCVVVGYDDENAHCYEDFLRQGKRLFCTATDDNHNRHPDSDPNCDSYGGYIMIASPALEYGSVTDALKKGLFYSSTGNYKNSGPEIKSLVYENGEVTIKTSAARTICYLPNRRECGCRQAPDGESITEATFRIGDDVKWFRFTVTDDKGYKAYTNAYFTDELK